MRSSIVLALIHNKISIKKIAGLIKKTGLGANVYFLRRLSRCPDGSRVNRASEQWRKSLLQLPSLAKRSARDSSFMLKKGEVMATRERNINAGSSNGRRLVAMFYYVKLAITITIQCNIVATVAYYSTDLSAWKNLDREFLIFYSSLVYPSLGPLVSASRNSSSRVHLRVRSRSPAWTWFYVPRYCAHIFYRRETRCKKKQCTFMSVHCPETAGYLVNRRCLRDIALMMMKNRNLEDSLCSSRSFF